ncbi:unnamed protein product [Didymodactylos carnosus]|uniref:Uncharacterized protein n=1 Tax=Didymodactylos carnosus TaxID=1234261 RepID=A0A814WJS1_9BILA|nr:unnamed protein product [Didymodactylos carnosus]CAF3964025.1 unnamed protein product [Didymodactylos carnosus]
MQNDVMVQGMKRIASEEYLLQAFHPSKIDFSSTPEVNNNDGYRVQQRQRKKFNATTTTSNEKMNKVQPATTVHSYFHNSNSLQNPQKLYRSFCHSSHNQHPTDQSFSYKPSAHHSQQNKTKNAFNSKLNLSFARYSSFTLTSNVLLIFANDTYTFEELHSNEKWPKMLCEKNFEIEVPKRVPTFYSIIIHDVAKQWNIDEIQQSIDESYHSVVYVQRIFDKTCAIQTSQQVVLDKLTQLEMRYEITTNRCSAIEQQSETNVLPQMTVLTGLISSICQKLKQANINVDDEQLALEQLRQLDYLYQHQHQDQQNPIQQVIDANIAKEKMDLGD